MMKFFKGLGLGLVAAELVAGGCGTALLCGGELGLAQII